MPAQSPFGYQPLKECWHINTETLRSAGIASDNVSSLYIPFSDGIIKAVNAKTKETIWQNEIGGEIYGEILFKNNNLYVSTLNDSAAKQDTKLTVSSISAVTGVTQWRKSFSIGPGANTTYLFDEQSFLYVITDEGKIFKLDKANGNTTLEKKTGIQITSSPVIKDGKLYLGSTDKKVINISLSAAEPIIKDLKDLDNTITALGILDNDLYVGDSLGKIYKLNIDNKRSDWVSRAGAKITAITGIGDNLLVSSSDNYVYLISQKNGNRIWKKRFSGKISGSAAVKNNVSVFSPLGDKTAVLVELKNGKTINQILLDSNSENSFTSSPIIIGETVILTTLQGFYAFSAVGCRN